MDLLKDDPVIWKIWSVATFKEFNAMMFKLRKELVEKGVRSIVVVDPNSVDHDNPSGYAIFWPKSADETEMVKEFINVDGVYHKVLCGG